MKQAILFGTNNAHKLREIREILGDIYQVLSLRDVGIEQDVEETELTLQGNAELKVRAFYELAKLPCFADDTGLEVHTLDGRPGVFSARYAGEDCSATDNVRKLLGEMEGKTDRTAVFKCVIAYYDGKSIQYFPGEISGKIIETPHGEGGFGYDPVFQPEGYDKTFAELPSEEKNSISHRKRAVEKLATFLLNGNPTT
ncbi:UNVERIFIED_CONTAM: hypothetical protein GTU68_013605 [Idotea baltica]|nr:hypothetical protein [Idotea baltica]